MDDVIEAARRLAPRIRAAGDQIEADRQLPAAIADAMAEAGLFTLLTPAEHGGSDVDPLTAIRAVEQIGRADGSAGWLATNSSYEAALLGWLSPGTIEEMRSEDQNLRMAGAIQPQGTGYAVDGGYRATGHWNFVSGIVHANWVSVGVFVLDGPGGERLRDGHGDPLTRVLFVPPESGRIVDHWDTMGMRGTGSHDFVIDDAFVRADRTMRNDERPFATSPRYRLPFSQMWGWCLHGGNAVGIARGALDDLHTLAQYNASKVTPALLRDRAHVQLAVGEAEAVVRAARAFLFDAVGAAWDAASNGAPDFAARDREARLALTHTVHEAGRAVGILYDAVGTPAIFRANRIERAYRDLQVMKHHIAASRRHYETIGASMLLDELTEQR
ncbi:MAG: acyl-CoA dehydrogenase family protein [Chloroflexi bacterium]|nr:acyl-CoA dehydrogenase family protein [Chloroflexota bacterium]MDA1145636.1 acyl-CoA dehydrogenase family protein [Chloroflexota bacterium]